jgi:DNA-binding FadR family transcriptional regulator
MDGIVAIGKQEKAVARPRIGKARKASHIIRSPGRNSLAQRVSEDLRRNIIEGGMAAGDRLPSEAQLTERFGVSRTVVREAIASLRADGLVEARQGAGVFVINNQTHGATPFQAIDTQRISSMIEVLELRTAIELEAAALAASRRSPAQEETIYECYNELGQLIARGEPTAEADFNFHLAIADATNNPRFREVLEMLGRAIIPRTLLQSDAGERTPAVYLQQIHEEHRQIADAISARDEQGARDALRTHLQGSQERYRSLLRGQ